MATPAAQSVSSFECDGVVGIADASGGMGVGGRPVGVTAACKSDSDCEVRGWPGIMGRWAGALASRPRWVDGWARIMPVHTRSYRCRYTHTHTKAGMECYAAATANANCITKGRAWSFFSHKHGGACRRPTPRAGTDPEGSIGKKSRQDASSGAFLVGTNPRDLASVWLRDICEGKGIGARACLVRARQFCRLWRQSSPAGQRRRASPIQTARCEGGRA